MAKETTTKKDDKIELDAENAKLKKELERLKKAVKNKKFGLVWMNIPEEFEEKVENAMPVLKEVPDKDVIKKDNKPTHILIEGDNYHALTCLNYTHKGKIDVIYIDPPYNTGAKDWKYNNNYVDINDAYRHSKWISFIANRLKLAKNLLRSSGVLICTIDENEHAALGLLLQELFWGYEIVCVTIVHNHGGIQGNNFSYCHEYAYFVYPQGDTYISKLKRDDIGPTPLRDWGKETSKREAARNCFYPIFVKNGNVIGFGNVSEESFHPDKANIFKNDILEVYPIDKNGVERKWRFSRQSVEAIKEELICKEIKSEFVILRAKKDYRWKTVWTDVKYNANVFGTKLVSNIIEEKFPFPKSLYAVKDCIEAVIHSKEKAIILDFFAGSGTTGHAVLELNRNDGGNRQFILCTNNENNICNEITLPRIKKVINGYNGIIDNKKYEGLGGSLKYYKTDFIGKNNVLNASDADKVELAHQAGELLAIAENTLYKTKENSHWQLYENGERYTAIYFREELDHFEKFVEMVEKLKRPVTVYVFSWGDDEFDDEFEHIEGTKVKTIPLPILEIYKNIYSAG